MTQLTLDLPDTAPVLDLGDPLARPSCTWGATTWCQHGKHQKCAWNRDTAAYGTDDRRAPADPDGHSWACACECHTDIPPCPHPDHGPVACQWCEAPTQVTHDQGAYQGGRLVNLACTGCGTPQIALVRA